MFCRGGFTDILGFPQTPKVNPPLLCGDDANGLDITAWQRYQRLGTLSFMGMVFMVAISWANKTPAVAALPQVRVSPSQKGITEMVFERSPQVVLSAQQVPLQRVELVEAGQSWLWHPLIVQMPTTDVPESPDTLPPANLPVNQGGVVNVPPVTRPEANLPSTGTSTTPSATQPRTIFPTNQTPTFSVPTLQSLPDQTPTPVTTSKPLEGSFRRISPAISPVPVIEFGQPLPKTTPAKPMPKPERSLPRL